MALCWYCQKRENGTNDPEESCETCDEVMETKVILISYSEERTKDERYPFRTGGWVAVSDEFIRERLMFLPQPQIEQVLQDRCMVIDDEWFRFWRLPMRAYSTH